MTTAKHQVTIKGVKDGLVFLLSDQCEFAELIKELEYKLEKSHQQILTGPIVHVHVKLGNRIVSDEQKDKIRSLIGRHGNLLIQSIESEKKEPEAVVPKLQMHKVIGIVRSGQTRQFEGDVLFIGDVNPGGSIICTGSIYVMGSMRGVVHAGFAGDQEAIIAASHLRPTQLRIAGVISRPPDEWGIEEAFMEFAYLKDNQMKIDKITQLHRIRPEANLILRGV
jgi:septum site-determining protein MinC